MRKLIFTLISFVFFICCNAENSIWSLHVWNLSGELQNINADKSDPVFQKTENGNVYTISIPSGITLKKSDEYCIYYNPNNTYSWNWGQSFYKDTWWGVNPNQGYNGKGNCTIGEDATFVCYGITLFVIQGQGAEDRLYLYFSSDKDNPIAKTAPIVLRSVGSFYDYPSNNTYVQRGNTLTFDEASNTKQFLLNYSQTTADGAEYALDFPNYFNASKGGFIFCDVTGTVFWRNSSTTYQLPPNSWGTTVHGSSSNFANYAAWDINPQLSGSYYRALIRTNLTQLSYKIENFGPAFDLTSVSNNFFDAPKGQNLFIGTTVGWREFPLTGYSLSTDLSVYDENNALLFKQSGISMTSNDENPAYTSLALLVDPSKVSYFALESKYTKDGETAPAYTYKSVTQPIETVTDLDFSLDLVASNPQRFYLDNGRYTSDLTLTDNSPYPTSYYLIYNYDQTKYANPSNAIAANAFHTIKGATDRFKKNTLNDVVITDATKLSESANHTVNIAYCADIVYSLALAKTPVLASSLQDADYSNKVTNDSYTIEEHKMSEKRALSVAVSTFTESVTTGIENPKDNIFSITTNGLTLSIIGTDKPVSIFDTMGHPIYQGALHEIQLPSRGMYLVKVGNECHKIIL